MCWLYEKCYPSINFPGLSSRKGAALSENGVVNAQFTCFYDFTDCSSNKNGFVVFSYAGTYSTHEKFLNSNDLEVTKFHYIKNPGVIKTKYYYLCNNRLCFPIIKFMVNSNENSLTKLNDNVPYNELAE